MGEAAHEGRGPQGERDAQRGKGRDTQPASTARLQLSQGRRAKKLTYKDQRDLDRLPDEIERLEAAIAADEETLHDPDLFARDPARFAALTRAIDDNRAKKEAAEHRWLGVAELAEALGA